MRTARAAGGVASATKTTASTAAHMPAATSVAAHMPAATSVAAALRECSGRRKQQ